MPCWGRERRRLQLVLALVRHQFHGRHRSLEAKETNKVGALPKSFAMPTRKARDTRETVYRMTFPANAHPPGLGFARPDPDPIRPAGCRGGASHQLGAKDPAALDVMRLPTALQVLQECSRPYT